MREAQALLKDSRYRPLRYKRSLYGDRLEVDPAASRPHRETGRYGHRRTTTRRAGGTGPHARTSASRAGGNITRAFADARGSPIEPRATAEDASARCGLGVDSDSSGRGDAKDRSIRRRADAAEEARRRKLGRRRTKRHSSVACRTQPPSRVDVRRPRRGLSPACAGELATRRISAAGARSACGATTRRCGGARSAIQGARSWTGLSARDIVFELVGDFRKKKPNGCAAIICRSDDEAQRWARCNRARSPTFFCFVRSGDRRRAAQTPRSDVRGGRF